MATLGVIGTGPKLATGSGATQLGPPEPNTGTIFWHYEVKPVAPYTSMACSAGIKVDGVLVRTLFSNEVKNAGIQYVGWDRKDDEGYLVPTLNKPVSLLVTLNNLEFEWGGGFANNSRAKTGLGKHRGGDPISSLCLFTDAAGVPTVAYKHGFEEGAVPPSGYAVADLLTRVNIAGQDGGSGLSIDFVRTNGKVLLCSGADPYNPNTSYLFATNISDKKKTVFAHGVIGPIGTGVAYSSVIDVLTLAAKTETTPADTSGLPTGLTVGSRFAFHSRGKRNLLHVLDLADEGGQPSGALVQTVTTITAPGQGVCDGDFLYLAHDGNQLSRFSVNPANGWPTLDGSFPTISGAQVVAVSVWGNELRLLTGQGSHQVKIYDKNTGAFIRANHPLGGAETTPDVTLTTLLNYSNGGDKFIGDIVSLANGNYHVASPGLWRVAEYTPAGAYVQHLMLVPRNYENVAVRNNPNIIFAGSSEGGFQEFHIDHTNPDYRKAATLARTRSMHPLSRPFLGIGPRFVTQFPNGRLFGQLPNYGTLGNYSQVIVELTASGYRKVREVDVEATLYADGSLRWDEPKYGGFLQKIRQDCLDLNAENPDWGPAYVYDRLALETHDNPNNSTLRGEITGNGCCVSWDGGLQWFEEKGFHLLLFKNGRRLARGYRALPQTPLIPFNKHGRFRTAGWLRTINEQGNHEIRTGGSSDRLQVFGPNNEFLRIHFHDEFNGVDIQSNQNVYFHQCGLMLTTYGNTGSELNGDNSAENACGNAVNSYTHWIPEIGRWRTFYSGETVHGIHFFDMLNLESVQVLELPA